MKSGDSTPHSQGRRLSRINPIPCIDAYFFKIHSDIVFHLRLGLLKGLFPVDVPVIILKELVPSSIYYLLLLLLSSSLLC